MNKLEVQLASSNLYIPEQKNLQLWMDSALEHKQSDTEIVIRIVDNDEIRQLNHRYRQQDKVTNILSFPFETPIGITLNLLGDLVICAPVMQMEAEQHNKTLEAHWAHIVIHGVLHLLGFDHIEPEEAHRMETKEINILQTLGFADPYQEKTPPS